MLKPALVARARVLRAVRQFFDERDFLEVETPVRIPSPALETHIDAEPSGNAYLRTSPELHMKRLLASGYERIFQIGPCFRQNEMGSLHHPEFAMLEWYRANADYMDILAETKALISFTAKAALGRACLTYRGAQIDLARAWQTMTVSDAFTAFAGWDPIAAFDADRFDVDLVDKIEPQMPLERPVVLIDFPAASAGLARLKPDDPRVAERWELYIGRVEIANAFSELADPVEQRARFEACAAKRRAMGKCVYGIDEAFMSALDRGMPPSAGAALGIDRLMMVLGGSSSLDSVLPFR